MTGRTYTLNTATGERTSRPYEDPTAALRQRIAELEADVRRWRWNAEEERRQREQTVRTMQAHHAERGVRLARAAKLINVRRKTVRMDDLREALHGELSPAETL